MTPDFASHPAGLTTAAREHPQLYRRAMLNKNPRVLKAARSMKPLLSSARRIPRLFASG